MTHGPSPVIHNPKLVLQVQNQQVLRVQHLLVVETNERTQGDKDCKITIDMFVFKGTQNVKEFFSWVDDVEFGFVVIDFSYDEKLNVVTNKLKGFAMPY